MSPIGFVYDATRSYALAFVLCIGLAAVAAASVVVASRMSPSTDTRS